MRKHIEVVVKNEVLRGYLDFADKEACIIVVHGIGGNKLGNKFIFRQFSDVAIQKNFSVLRMDFIGSGESDGKFENTNHLEQADQLHEIINYAKKTLDFKKIHLVGTSIGCLVILNTIQKYEDNIDSISLWNPNIDTEQYMGEYKGI